MKAIRWLAAAAIVAAPLVFESASADAATANQYRAQGRGVYLTSKGNPKGWRHRGYGYGRPYGYGYGRPYGYGYARPYGWHRHWGPAYGGYPYRPYHRWY